MITNGCNVVAIDHVIEDVRHHEAQHWNAQNQVSRSAPKALANEINPQNHRCFILLDYGDVDATITHGLSKWMLTTCATPGFFWPDHHQTLDR